MTKKKMVRKPELMPIPGLPTLPEAFQHFDYDGWLPERIKRFQLKTYQKTQAERLGVLRQINAIQGECLALARNESNWRHIAQEDRLRQKRLDIEEMELDIRMEELQDTKRRVKERPAERLSPPPDPIQEALRRLRKKLRAGVEARSDCEQLKKEFPDYAEEIETEFLKMIWDLREDA